MVQISNTNNPNTGKEVGPQSFRSLLVRMQNGVAILEDQVTISGKIQHSLILQLRSFTPYY